MKSPCRRRIEWLISSILKGGRRNIQRSASRDNVQNRCKRLNGNYSAMEIAVVVQSISDEKIAVQPWIHYRAALAERNIHIRLYGASEDAFRRPFDAMLLHVWQDWDNREYFKPRRILPVMERYTVYRVEFPETVQIVLNHTDMSRRPYAIPYWRPGDPILYRTPAYDRRELYPFPPEDIWPYEEVWGQACFVSNNNQPKYKAGFIGRPSGSRGYRQRVAEQTARVGIGICQDGHSYSKEEHDDIMAQCQMIVCPKGWGEQSLRHWDAWLSSKPVLTDKACDSVEMIPGQRLQEGVHYLVFNEPEDIPDIVSDWTRPSRRDDLAQIAQSGHVAALSYDARGRITEFFERVVSRSATGTVRRSDSSIGVGAKCS
jgi:hypothetical protein